VGQQEFLLINFILIAIFGVLFLVGRRSALKNSPNFKMTADYAESQNKAKLKVIGENLEDLNSEKIKSLNVMFLYNGHIWDAHEVLGIKPGCSIDEIKVAFEKVISKNDAGAHEFIKTALAAIFQNLKNQGYGSKT
jgi:hypothetical protein